MPDNTTEYRAKYTQIMQVPAPDDLITGWYTAAPIKLTGATEFSRGTLLMSTADGSFTPATSSGISSAEELAILCEDIKDLESGAVIRSEAYFSGDFLGTRIILAYETESDSHAELIEAVRAPMRKHNLMLK